MWRFGHVRFDPARRVLCAGTQTVHLPPREADLLGVLLEAGGQPVTKDKLLATIWSDCAVEEGNLAQQVSLLRRAIASVAGEAAHAYIETIPKLGYRFAIPAMLEVQAPNPMPEPFSAPAPLSRSRARAIAIVLAALLWGSLCFALGVWYARG